MKCFDTRDSIQSLDRPGKSVEGLEVARGGLRNKLQVVTTSREAAYKEAAMLAYASIC